MLNSGGEEGPPLEEDELALLTLRANSLCRFERQRFR
jgi:hypothetical protein